MSYIFHKFATTQDAQEFKCRVDKSLGLPVLWFDTQEEADAHDPFPFELTPPILHVWRSGVLDPAEHVNDEFVLEIMAQECHGEYAGT